MRITKSEIVLSMVEELYEQEDSALVDKVYRDTGIDLMNEDLYSEEELEYIAMNEVSFFQQLGQSFNPFHGAKTLVGSPHSIPTSSISPIAATPPMKVPTGAPVATATAPGSVHDYANQAAHHVMTGVRSVGHVVGGAAQGAANAVGAPAGGIVHQAASAIAANPGIAGAATLGLGALAALRMRKAAKNRAQLRGMGR